MTSLKTVMLRLSLVDCDIVDVIRGTQTFHFSSTIRDQGKSRIRTILVMRGTQVCKGFRDTSSS